MQRAVKVEPLIKYYKYVNIEYEQPRIYSDTNDGQLVELSFTKSAGSVSGSLYSAFYPNTGIFSAYRDESKFTDSVNFKLKYNMKLTGFSLQLGSDSGSTGNLYEGYVFLGNTWGGQDTQLGYIAKINEGAYYKFDLSENTSYSNFYTFRFRNGGSAYNDRVKLTQMRLYGEWMYPTLSTEDDYDFYEVQEGFKVPEIPTTRYYKNNDGTVTEVTKDDEYDYTTSTPTYYGIVQ